MLMIEQGYCVCKSACLPCFELVKEGKGESETLDQHSQYKIFFLSSL